jgi:hypothetical protein
MNQTIDKNGNIVRVGTKVKVLEISPSLLSQLSDDERPYVLSMKGEVFTVYEIDEYGQAWVEKWWRKNEPESFSHDLGLSPTEMEVSI